jgi:RecJ-like exonuclease
MRLSEILKEDTAETQTCMWCDGRGVDDWSETCFTCGGKGITYLDGSYVDDEVEELEEIKVTKTLAKKRTTPMKDMATKEKMTRKKKGKDGKIKKDARKPMNRNVHDLANITLKGEYRS